MTGQNKSFNIKLLSNWRFRGIGKTSIKVQILPVLQSDQSEITAAQISAASKTNWDSTCDVNVVTMTNAGAGAQSQRNALILWKSRSSGNFNSPTERRERCNFYPLTWQLLKKMSLGTPEPQEAIHSPNEKWESVLSEGNFNAREQKGDNTQTNSWCWIF